MTSRGYQGCQVEGCAHGTTTTPDQPSATQGAAVTGERRHAGEGSDVPPVQLPQFGQFVQESPGHDRTHSRHRAQEVFFRAPYETALDGVVEIPVDCAELPLTPLDVCANATTHGGQRMLQAITLGHQQRVEGG